MKQATLISFDGVSGTGKDTQIALIKKNLETLGKTVVVIDENKLDPIRLNIHLMMNLKNRKEFAYFSILLFSAGRKYVYETYVRPLLNKDVILLLNRSYITSMVQQSVSAGDYAAIKEIDDNLGNIKPDLKLVLYCNPGTAFSRIRKQRKEQSALAGKFTKSPEDFRIFNKRYVEVGKMENCIMICSDEDMFAVNKKIMNVILGYLHSEK